MTVNVEFDQESGAQGPVQGYGLQPLLFQTGKVDCDNNYPTGGYDMTKITGMFGSCKNINFSIKNGYLMEFDPTNKKMLVKVPAPAESTHTHTITDSGNAEVEEESIAAPAHQRIYHGAVGAPGAFGVEVIRGGTSGATARVVTGGVGSGYLDVNNIGLDGVYYLAGELTTDYVLHCADTAAHMAADTVNNSLNVLDSSWANIYTMLNALKAAYNAHDAESGTYHGAAGSAHQITSADASTPASAVTLANELRSDYEAHRAEGDTLYTLVSEIRADYIAHCADTTSHMAADTTNNDPAALSANTLAAIIACLNSLKAKYNSHDSETGTFHPAAGTTRQTSSADATSYASAITLANELKADLNAHAGYTTGVYTLLAELRIDYIAHCAMGAGTHSAADTVNNAVATLTGTLAGMIAFANDLKAKYNAHDAETGTYHLAAGVAHQTSSADANSYASLVTLANELKADYEAHRADDACHDTIDSTNTISAADAADEAHLDADTVNTVAAADASASLHMFPDSTNTISTVASGLTFQNAETLTGLSTGATATESGTTIDVWDLAYNPALVQNVLNNSNAALTITSPSVTLATTQARVDLANAEIETLLSDAYTSLKVTYLKNSETSSTSSAGGSVAAAAAAEVTGGTNLSSLTDIPYLAWGY